MSTLAATRVRRRAATQSPPPLRRLIWAVVQVAVLGAEVFLLLFILAQPGFRPRDVQVQGVQHLRAGEVAAALALPPDRSIFLLDPASLADRLKALPWVQSASVTLALPDRVSVTVSEWQPAAVIANGEQSYYLNARGVVLAPAFEAGGLPVIDRQGVGAVKAGDGLIDPDLMQELIALQRGFAPAFRVRVLSFVLDPQQVLTLRTDRGFAIIFGQMATADQRATLEPKLGALRSLATRIDLASAPLVYVNLMNPRAPAVLMKSR
ncbi:MAG TPA: FtsQ-type POTRA domain-containing protein [Candidatus Limnocylindrales bacterium]|nr:FtsQ-type POTRA domain-containing protein [Candidatus Limnocylindrales bacterium]